MNKQTMGLIQIQSRNEHCVYEAVKEEIQDYSAV